MMKSRIVIVGSVVDGLRVLRGAASPARCAIVAIAICALSISSAKAALIAQWNLDANSQTASTVNGAFLSAASSLTITPNAGSSLAFPTTGGNPNGYGELTGKLNTLGNSTFAFSITANASQALTSLTFDFISTKNTVTGTLSWTYKIGTGGTVTSLGSVNLTGTAWTPETLNLSSIPSLSNGQQVFFVATLSNVNGGNSGNDSEIGFDNVTINAVPEPITYALAAFGLIFVGGTAGRFYLARRRSATAG
jgi:hypothetical protein